MKILVVQESDWIDKGPHQSHHLLERLSKKGNEIRVIDFEIGWRSQKRSKLISPRQVFYNVQKVIKESNITVIRPSVIKLPICVYLSILFTHTKEIAKQIKEFKPDVILGFSILNSFIALRLAHKNGIPFVYYLIDELHRLVPQSYFQPLAKLIESYNLRKADQVLTINEKLNDYAISLGANKEKTQVIRAGVDIEIYDSPSRKKIRDELGIKDDEIVLFFMGWLYSFSGLKEVAEELAKQIETKFKLLILGKGELSEVLNKIKSNLGNKIILLDWKPYHEVPGYVSASDVCLLPAYNVEIMRNIVPIKMYEYMAAGKPVISTRLAGLMKEFGEDNGVIYVNKPEEVIDKVKELLSSGKLTEEGKKARKFVEKFDWDKLTVDFERILDKEIESKKGETY